MRGSWWLLIGTILPWLLAACAAGAPAARPPLLVAAAANVQPALRELAAGYEAATGQPVTLAVGSTGQLVQQIASGAPADVFFAADEQGIDALIAQGHVAPETRRVYAVGRLALIASPHAAVRVARLGDLADPAVRHVALANPQTAPYGRAAREALERSGLWPALQPKLVYGENIVQAFQYVETGSADAGLVALSLVVERPAIAYQVIDEALHEPVRQAAGVVAASRQPAAARAFLDYVTGPAGRAVWERYGYRVP